METQSLPHRTDLRQKLPRHVLCQIIHALRGAMPPVSDAPEDLVRRDNAAIAHFASLLPGNIDGVDRAAKYVGAGAHAMDCLRLAHKYHGSPDTVLKCTAQAASMLRQARALRALLTRLQTERRKQEADPAPGDEDARAEQQTIGLMTEALADAPPSAIAPPPARPDEPAADIAAEADRYALAHGKRAALIRALGRLPDRLSCGPMKPALVHAIVTGKSPVLRALDRNRRQAERAAA
jgi:hypothetical protein